MEAYQSNLAVTRFFMQFYNASTISELDVILTELFVNNKAA